MFVQHRDDTYEHCEEESTSRGVDYKTYCLLTIPGYSSWTNNPVTEWPANLPLDEAGETRALPRWANQLIDAPDGSTLSEGSLTQYYSKMSRGKFTLRGYVYPRVYVPKHEARAYQDSAPFDTGGVRLSHEILSYIKKNPRGLNLTPEYFDRYRNGTNQLGSDGIFDAIILVFRFSKFRDVFGSKLPTGSAITSLGAAPLVGDPNSPSYNAFAPSPVTLGGMKVIDNLVSGSGVTVAALTRKDALRIIAHEWGHRQFGQYHVGEYRGEKGDSMSIMQEGEGIPGSLTAGDRLKLDWAQPVVLNIQNFTTQEVYLEDSIESGKVLYIKSNSPASGDLVVESRLWSNFWDSPPNGINDDGDRNDHYLPQEGLYLYKVGDPTSNFKNSFFSFLENSGAAERAKFYDSSISAAFVPGQIFSPQTEFLFKFYKSKTLDPRVAITDIRREGKGFRFKVWSNY